MKLLPRRKLGRTGMQPRALGMGAAFIGGGERDEAETIATIERALDLGIDYFDSYGGQGEERWGKALSGVERTSFYMQATLSVTRISRPRPRAGASNRAFHRCAWTISTSYWSTIRLKSKILWGSAAPLTSCRR